MAASTPDTFRDLVSIKKAFGNLATLASDATPPITLVWVEIRAAQAELLILD